MNDEFIYASDELMTEHFSRSGIIYDLIECLHGQLDMNGLTTTSMFFLSPVADSSLAYANIMAEWLSANKQSKVG